MCSMIGTSQILISSVSHASEGTQALSRKGDRLLVNHHEDTTSDVEGNSLAL
jgi:hypothetical protein